LRQTGNPNTQIQPADSRYERGTSGEHVSVTEQTYYCWKKKYGGVGTEQLRELKRFQKENEQLCKAVSDRTLNKLILVEAAKGV
jgi:hypothetical protein